LKTHNLPARDELEKAAEAAGVTVSPGRAECCYQVWSGDVGASQMLGLVYYRSRKTVYKWQAMPMEGTSQECRDAKEAVRHAAEIVHDVPVTVKLKLMEHRRLTIEERRALAKAAAQAVLTVGMLLKFRTAGALGSCMMEYEEVS
jgi:hypothetical protein